MKAASKTTKTINVVYASHHTEKNGKRVLEEQEKKCKWEKQRCDVMNGLKAVKNNTKRNKIIRMVKIVFQIECRHRCTERNPL